MSCLTGLVDSVYVVRWVEPEVSDVMKIVAEIVAAYRDVGPTLIYIAIIPADCPAPATEVRQEMTRRMDIMLEHCSMMYFVIEGTGFRHSMLRSALAGILLVSGKRGRCTVYTTVDDALAQASRAAKLNLPSFRRQARERDLIV